MKQTHGRPRLYRDIDGAIVIVERTYEGLVAMHAQCGAYPVLINQERLDAMEEMEVIPKVESRRIAENMKMQESFSTEDATFSTEDGATIYVSSGEIEGNHMFAIGIIPSGCIFLSEQDLEFWRDDIESVLIDYRQARMQSQQ
jgi:hypothetical protein